MNKIRGIYLLAEKLLDSQEELCFMKLITSLFCLFISCNIILKKTKDMSLSLLHYPVFYALRF
jgi:hypothetical protein